MGGFCLFRPVICLLLMMLLFLLLLLLLLLFSFFYCSDYCLFLLFSCLCLFPGVPPGGAGCRERSQRSCLRPGGLPSLTQNPGLQRPFRSRRLCRAASVAPWPELLASPPNGGPGCKAQRPFRKPRFTSLRRILPVVVSGAIHLFKAPVAGGLIQPQPAALTVQGK